MLQLTFKSDGIADADIQNRASSLSELRQGEQGILDRLDLPEDQALRLMELGFLPGARIVAAHSAPGGDPRVYRVDGSEFGLRRETAKHLKLQDAE
jgi:ferrous iron transport protein A